MKKKHYLTISFNEFYPNKPVNYTETICDENGAVIGEREFKRTPRSARFDEVFENGGGHVNSWNAHKSKRIYNHPLERKQQD